MYLHIPAVEVGSWWRVDTASGSSTPTTVYAHDGTDPIGASVGTSGSTVRATTFEGTAQFWSGTPTLYLKQVTYKGALTGLTVTSTGAIPAAPGAGPPADIAAIASAVAGLPNTYASRAGGTATPAAPAPFWNVLDFGAKADGATDDTAAVHAARDAAGVNGRLYFPPGTYLVSSASAGGLTASVAGQSWQIHPQSTLKIAASVSSSSAGFTISAPNVKVEGGTFDGSLIAQQVQVVKAIPGASGVRLTGLNVTGNPMFYGITSYNVSDVRITDCQVSDTAAEGIWVQNNLTGPSNISDVVISGCVVDNSGMSTSSATSGITVLGTSTTQRCSRVRFVRNTVLLPRGQTSGFSGGIAAVRCDGVTIADNVVDGSNLAVTCPGCTSARVTGNLLKGFNQVGIEFPGDVTDVVISGNNVDSDGMLATSGVQTSGGTNTNMTISGNTFKNINGAGANVINFSSLSVTARAAIVGNVITATVISGTGCGVLFSGSAAGITAVGNLFDLNSTAGALGIEFLRALAGATVTGNEFANIPGAALQVSSSHSADTIDYITLGPNTYRSTATRLSNVLSGGATLGSNIAQF